MSRSRATHALAAALLLALAPGRAPADSPAEQTSKLELAIETPTPGAVIGDPGGMAFIAGKALALFGKYQTFDIMFVLDTSESTSAPSGADVDGDGRVGERHGGRWLTIFGKVLPLGNTDRGDSILAAEIAAVEVLLEQLDPRSTRVGIVAFAGDHDPLTPDAYTVIPLTTEYSRVRRGLDELMDVGPNGMTNMVFGVQLGIAELCGTRSSLSEKREGARRVMLFLTDGTPTLPFDNQVHNMRMTIEKARRARRLGIRIDTYAIGDDALHEPIVPIEIAAATDGIFTPVRHPNDLRAIFEDISFADIETLRIRNLTTDTPAAYSIRNADGSFSSLVPMKEGKNVVEVFARATDGSEARKTIAVRFLPDGEIQPLSPRLVAQRNRLLENRLLDLQRRSVEIEAEKTEDMRRALAVEIEEERAKALERSEEARRRLRIETEK